MKMRWLLFVAFILFGCNAGTERKQTIPKDSLPPASERPTDPVNPTNSDKSAKTMVPQSFWDSISMQLQLTAEQLKKYTTLDLFELSTDSMYYEQDSSYKKAFGFWGDSAYTVHNFKIAILKHNGASWSSKYLLVFDSNGVRSLSYQVIEEDADRDGERAYSYREYKILTDSTFETTEVEVPEDADVGDKNVKRYRVRWKINMTGIIDSIPRKKVVKSKP